MKSDKEINLIKEMKNSIGVKEPVDFFHNMTDLLESMLNRLSDIEDKLKIVTTQSSLGINWDPKIASEMLVAEIEKMRANKEVFATELHAFKVAYGENEITKDYQTFVNFWVDTLGWHPFIDRI